MLGQADLVLSELLDAAVEALDEAGVPSARLDAELLLVAAIAGDREELFRNPDRTVEATELRFFQSMLRRRLKREPVAYILGRAYFRNLELEVNRTVLIPRPETELLVEQARDGDRVIDVGTGSGAVALAIADEFQDVSVVATDSSAEALETARLNAARLLLSVTLIEADLISDGPFDLIVSNPPYVREDEWPELEPEITKYEPRQALIAGSDGLDLIRRLVEEAPAQLVEGGRLALEVGADQAKEVEQLMRREDFHSVEALPDLAGIDRVVRGIR